MSELDKLDIVGLPGHIVKLTETTTPDHEDDFARDFTKELFEKMPKALQEIAKGYASDDGKIQSKQYVEQSGVSVYNVFDCIEPKYNQIYLAELYDKSPIHAAAVDAKINNIVGLGFSFVLTVKGEQMREAAALKSKLKKKRFEEQIDSTRIALVELLDTLNNRDEFEEILDKFAKDRFTMGNGYMEIGRDAEGRIGYIGHLPAKHMRIRRNRDGFVQYVNNQPIFFRNFGDLETPDPFGLESQPNEVLHYRYYSPSDEYYGVPEIVSALNAIAGIEFAQRYNIDYFENKAVPRYIIKTKGLNLTTTQQADLLKFFEKTTKGVSHRTVLVPLPAGDRDIHFQPVEAYKQDGSFIEYIKQNINFILGRHRVPILRIGLSDGTGSLSESREADKSFKEVVCRPEQKVIEKKFNKVIAEFTDLFHFKLKEYALTDEDQKSLVYERYMRWGVYVPDEVRAEIGMQPRPDGKGGEPVDMRSVTELGNQEQNTQAQAEEKAQAFRTRERDQNRDGDTPDSPGNANGRRTQGEGPNPNK